MAKKDIPTKKLISSGGVVYRRGEDGGIEVALISVKGGHVWGLPKGLVEVGENIAHTAHREVKEETGLDGEIVKKIGNIHYFFTEKSEDSLQRYLKIVYFFLMEYSGGDTKFHDDEVEDARWFPIKTALKTLTYEAERGIVKRAEEFITKELT